MKKAVVVLPTYNEAGNIEEIVREIFALKEKNLQAWDLAVLVVDDYSPDNTAGIVKNMQGKYPDLHLLSGPKQGLGKAYARGFSQAIEKLGASVVVEMDADLSHDPRLITKMLAKIEKGADFVTGSRYIRGGSIPKDWGLHRKVFSVLGNLVVQLGFMNFRVRDWTSGFRAMKSFLVKDILPEMSRYNGYVFQIAFLDKAIKRGANIQEVPLKFKERKKGVSKINFFDYITNIFTYILGNSSFAKYFIVGMLGFAVDFGFAYFFISGLGLNQVLANIMSAELAIIFNFLMNNFWSFAHKAIGGGLFEYLKKFLLFNLVTSGSIFIQGVGLYLALRFLGMFMFSFLAFAFPAWVLYKVLIIAFLVIPYSYFMYNRVVWTKKK